MLQFTPKLKMKFFAVPMRVFLLAAIVALSGVNPMLAGEPDAFSHFIAIKNFSKFEKSKSTTPGETVLTSPDLAVPINWTELVASWNADAPTGSHLKVEARGVFHDHVTKFYNLGVWAADNGTIERHSVRGQKDDDGTVSTDTL